MLIQQGPARSLSEDRRLAWWLAGVAGALNTAGFFAVGLYSSNMTGNVSALADHIGTGHLMDAAGYAALVATFVAGAMLSTMLVNAGRRRGIAAIYAYSILVEAGLMLLLGVVEAILPGLGHGASLAFGLSFLMGLQNAVVTRISNARVRTTHVTGMITDLGIELANLLEGYPDPADAAANRGKLRLHAETVACFAAGGVAGVAGFKLAGPLLLFAAAAVLLALAAPAIRVRQR